MRMHITLQYVVDTLGVDRGRQLRTCKKHGITQIKDRINNRVQKGYTYPDYLRLINALGYKIIEIDGKRQAVLGKNIKPVIWNGG